MWISEEGGGPFDQDDDDDDENFLDKGSIFFRHLRTNRNFRTATPGKKKKHKNTKLNQISDYNSESERAYDNKDDDNEMKIFFFLKKKKKKTLANWENFHVCTLFSGSLGASDEESVD